MKAKEKAKSKLLEYLANPDNEILSRSDYAVVILGYKDSKQIYRLFSVLELDQIEIEALEMLRTKYARALAKIDKALLERAQTGDPQAIKLAYQRFEGWGEKKRLEHTGKDGQAVIPAITPDMDLCEAARIYSQVVRKGK